MDTISVAALANSNRLAAWEFDDKSTWHDIAFVNADEKYTTLVHDYNYGWSLHRKNEDGTTTIIEVYNIDTFLIAF